jgi:hypothetical protein
MEPDAVSALSRLGSTRPLERAYLEFLIGRSRWEQAESVAAKIAARHDAWDSERLLDFTDRLLSAGRADGALAMCRAIKNCPAPDVAPGGAIGNGLTNGYFATAPAGHGFDWRLAAPVSVRVQWKTGWLAWTPGGSEPDVYTLLEQWIVLTPRRYRLRFEYQTPGTGLRWVLAPTGAAGEEAPGEQSSPPLAAAAAWRQAEWNFRAPQKSLARLRFIYRREDGSVRLRGYVGIRNVNLEPL